MNGPEQIPDMATGLDPRDKLIYYLFMQGLGVVVMVLWGASMYLDIKELKTELRSCNAEKVILLQKAVDDQKKTSDEGVNVMKDIRDLMRSEPIQIIRSKK